MNLHRKLAVTARRNWRAVTVVGVAVVLIVSAHAGYRALWRNIDVEISGTYKVSTLDDRSDVQAAYARMYPDSPQSSGIPSGYFVIVDVDWRDKQRVHWPARACNFSVLLAHPAGQAVGFVGRHFNPGTPGLIVRAMSAYPEIPRRTGDSGEVRFAGTTFGVDDDAARSTLSVMIQSPTRLAASAIQVGVLFFCDDRVVSFQWLKPRPSA